MSHHAAAPIVAGRVAEPPAPRPKAIPVPEPAMESSALAIGAFAGLPAGAVVDADAQRALATWRLLAQLAPALGLDAARIRIICDAGAAARLDAAGASGLQEESKILLHPERFQPGRPESRGLLAHEAAHAAQRLLPGPADEAAAECEAATIAAAVARGLQPTRPVVPLRTLRAAADAGAGETTAPTITRDMVELNRKREIAAIRSALSGLWVSDGDVFDVLRILESVPHSIIEPLLNALPEGDRFALADNINPPHAYRNRRTALACYCRTLSDGRLRSAVDLKVFRALPATGLSTEEIETARWVLGHLSDGQRQELLRSDNRAAIARIIGAPRPSADELGRIGREAKEAATSEAKLFDKATAAEKHADDPETNALLARVKTLLTDRPNAAAAGQALDLLGAGDTEDARFQFLAERLEDAGLIDVLVDLLPPRTLLDVAGRGAVFFALVRSRLPTRNEQAIEGLLHDSWFDSVSAHEALFAYKLVKSLPLTAQYKFRRRDGGKWYLRLLDNLPTDPSTKRSYPGLEIRRAETKEELEELRKAGTTEVDEDALLYNASQRHEKKLSEQGATNTLNDLIAAFKEAEGWIFRDAEAIDLYRRLVALGGSTLTAKVDRPADRMLREAVVHELDRLGYIATLFDNLPDSFLFAEENRIATVQLMLARDPSRARAHARDLVSRHWTDWMVKDGEAWLAYQCVKALPADEREAFIAENSAEWDLINSEMSEAQRQSRDLNLYIGDKAGTDRASVLGQLADAATWAEDNAGTLANLVRMAITMTEHRFAFERSREFKAAEQPKLAALVEEFRLWHPVKRPDYKPKLLEGTHWYQEGPFALVQQVWGGLVTVVNADLVFVRGGAGVRADLRHVQKMLGGNLFGARVADPAKRGAEEPLAHPQANKVTLLFGRDQRSAEVRLPELLLETGNIQTGGTTVQFGRVRLGGLRLFATYASETLDQPSKASAEVDSVAVEDLLLAKTESMLTIGRLLARALRLALGTVDAVPKAIPGKGELTVPFLLIVPNLLGLLALMAVPAYLYGKITSLFGQGLDKGLADDFANDVAERTKAISFTLGSLDAENVSTSGGQHVEHAGIRDLSVQIGLDKATRLRAERNSVSSRLAALGSGSETAKARDTLAKRLAEVDRQLVALASDEREYVEIMRQIQAGKLSPQRQKALQDRLDALDFEKEGGAFLDIGSAEVSGLKGTITSKEPIRLSKVHGEGGGGALNQLLRLPNTTDAEMSRRAGDAAPAAAPGTFRLELGDIHTGEISIGGGLRTTADIDKQLLKLAPRRDTEAIKPLYESLQILRAKAERYERMVQHGISQLDGEQLQEFRRLRADLAARADVIVKSIDIVQATLDADVATGAIGFRAASATLRGIDTPGTGVQVDELIVRGLGLRAVPKGGLLGFTDWRKNLRDAGASFDSLEVSGARSKYHGLLFEKATLTGGYGGLLNRGDRIVLGLGKLSVENVGLAPRIGLLQHKLDGLRERRRLAGGAEDPKRDAEIRLLEGRIAKMQQLVDARLAAYAALEAAKTPDKIEAAKKRVYEADSQIMIGLAQYGAAQVSLEEFGVAVTGAGDVLSDALGAGIDPLTILKRGEVSVLGTGPDNRLFKSFALKGAQSSAHPPVGEGPSLATELGNFEVGETRLAVRARREGKAIVFDVPELRIAALAIDHIELTSAETEGGVQAYSEGRSGIEGIRFQGSVRLDPTVDQPATFEDYRLAHVSVGSLRIDRIQGSGLGLALPGDKFEITIRSGAISGIYAEGLEIDLPANARPVVTGKAGIEAVDDLVIGQAVAGAWRVNGGKLKARKLEAAFLKDGEIEASVGSLSLLGATVRGPDGWVRLSLADLGGKLGFKDGVLDIHEMHLGRLDVPALHWRVGAKGFVEADRPLALTDLKLKAQVEMAKPAADGSAPASPVGKVKVKMLHVGGFQAAHLIYQDEDQRIEIGRDESKLPKHMKGFKPLELKNLNVWDLEWQAGAGFKSGHASLQSYQLSGAFDGLKSGLKAGLALKGSGMKAEVTGPGLFEVNVGRIEKVRGDYGDGKISTRFATGAITGSVAFGPDFIEARNLNVAGLSLGATRYTDGPRSATLKHLFVENVKIGSARQNFAISTDPAKPGAKTATTLEIKDVEFLNATADRFVYDGRTTKQVNGKEIAATQHVEGSLAVIKRLVLGSITHDPATAKTVLKGVKLDAGEKPEKYDRPLAMYGLAATFVSGIGDKQTTTELLTNVQAGPLTAEQITFQTVDLGTEPGPDGKPVTGTRIEGGFDLTRIGLTSSTLKVKDATGAIVLEASASEIELKGLDPRFLANGLTFVPFKELSARTVRIKAGAADVAIDFAAIGKTGATLAGMQPGDAFDVLGARLDSIQLQGARLTYTIDRSAPSTPGTPSATPAKWILDALTGLDGTLNVHVDNVDVIGDVDLPAPVRGGVIDFGDLRADDGLWPPGDIEFFANRRRIWARNRPTKYPKTLYESPTDIPGITPADIEIIIPPDPDASPIEVVNSHGSLNLKAMLEETLNAPPSTGPSSPAQPLGALNPISVRGSLRTGDGVVGKSGNNVELSGRNAGKNIATISSVSLGGAIHISIPDLQASHGHFSALGKPIETGAITANVSIAVYGLGNPRDAKGHLKFDIVLNVASGRVSGVDFGDVSLATESAAAAQPPAKKAQTP